MVLGAFTILSTLVFSRLKSSDGDEETGQDFRQAENEGQSQNNDQGRHEAIDGA